VPAKRTAKPTSKPKKRAKGGRPPEITEALLAEARVLMGAPRHLSVVDAAAELGVGKTQLYSRLSATAPKAPLEDEDADLELAEDATDEDTLLLARRLLSKVERRIRSADPVRFASLIEKANGLIGRVEQIEARRPKAPAPDEVNERLRAAMGSTVGHLLKHTREAAAKLSADRKAFAEWARSTLAPAHAFEAVARVDAMLGGQAA
jgi:hypothetical protein